MPVRFRIGTAAIFGAVLGIFLAFAGRLENGGKFHPNGGWWSGFVIGGMVAGAVLFVTLAVIYNLVRAAQSGSESESD
jgi:hypothetical protein